MDPTQENCQSLLKIAQIYHSFSDRDSRLPIINRILKKYGDINYQIPANITIYSHLVGFTALHIAAFYNDISTFDILLKNEANFTIQNQYGSTILHYVMDNLRNNSKFVDSILSAHIEHNIPANPRNNKGISHFHIACLTDNVRAVEYFLENNVNANEATNLDFHELPGFTPLHIATRSSRKNVFQLLLKHNDCNLYVKDATGMTPLHILMEQKLDKLDPLNANEKSNGESKSVQRIEEMMKLLLDTCDTEEMFNDDIIGLTHFQVACTMQNSSLSERLIKQTRNLDHQIELISPVWPGYTALHFAAHCNIDIVKMLLHHEANISLKDAKGVTPFDICLQKLAREEIISIMAFEGHWKNVSFTNSGMKLLDLISAMTDSQTLVNYLSDSENYVNRSLPGNFVLWPGFTPLHVMVLMCTDEEQELIQACLDQGADVIAPDHRGKTPLMLAFQLNKLEIVDLLLNRQSDNSNSCDDEGLSHLHIACEVNNSTLLKTNVIEKKIIQNVNVVYKGQTSLGHVRPGCTPLHVAIANQNEEMVEMLLNHQADCRIEDENGLTPIDWFLYVYPDLSSDSRMVLTHLFSQELDITNSKDEGLTWLHVASCFNSTMEVKKLLQRKVYVDPKITCKYPSDFWFEYIGCTPLHLLVSSRFSKKYPQKVILDEIFDELISNGADILAMRSNGMTPLYESLINKSDAYVTGKIARQLLSDDDLLKRLRIMSNITILHVACHLLDEFATAKAFRERIDVNARVNDNCKIWPGCTALHVLVNNLDSTNQKNVIYHLSLLLDGGADVTIKNSAGHTPVHLIFQRRLWYDKDHLIAADKILNYQKDFSANPVSSTGMSHFHAACILSNVEAVKGFIKHGVDVNRPVDLFAPKFAGDSPLHLAINRNSESIFGGESLLSTVDLLLKNGGNVRVENCYGNSIIHKVVELEVTRIRLLEILMRCSHLRNSENIFGKTPLEIVLKMEEIPIRIMKFLIKEYRFRIDSYHTVTGESYIRFIVSPKHHKTFQAKALKLLNLTDLDEKGRSLLHHLCVEDAMSTEKYVEFIEKFEQSDMDVDLQDKSGQTPLHVAAKFFNQSAVKALLETGADINIVDKNGKTPLVYALDFKTLDERHGNVLTDLGKRAKKLERLRIEVSPLNLLTVQKYPPGTLLVVETNILNYYLREELSESRNVVIEPNMNLRHLIMDYGIMSEYPFMTEARRSRIDKALKSSWNDHRFRELKPYLKLLHKRSVRRVPLTESAITSLKKFFWSKDLWIPYECAIIIIEYLGNLDLINFIAAIDPINKDI